MNPNTGPRNGLGRGPARPELYRSKAAQKILADLFVTKWIAPARSFVSLGWLKVVAERVMGDTVGLNGYVWIAEVEIQAALKRSGFKTRGTGKGLYVGCRPASLDAKDWRFFRRGGHYPPTDTSKAHVLPPIDGCAPK